MLVGVDWYGLLITVGGVCGDFSQTAEVFSLLVVTFALNPE